ncbi:MAG: hypothetical protein KatS3mg027_2356 [Bacteroidia bacterium]|nr:MAG: hypothetical protein KatS3mg027_2356 [Bacteroidia bacterium]
MNLLKILIIFLFQTIWICSAQLLVFDPETLFEKFPIFNPEHIQNKKIKKIVFDIIDKKDWQEAEDKNLTEVYEFEPSGKLKRSYHTSIKKIIRIETQNKKHKNIVSKEYYEYDTTSTEYVYQPNLIVERHKFPNNYSEATYFKLCNNKWICKEEKYIESYRTLTTNNSILNNLYLKAQDSIATYEYPNQIKQIYYNNEKAPYKEKFTYFNSNHQIYEITEQLIVASGRVKKTFLYTSDNLLESVTMTIDFGNPETHKIEYFYDEKKRVLSEKHFKNNQHTKEYQYIYSPNNNELISILIRTFEDKNIRIIKLFYEYY